jgi:hypothetical protein
MNFNEKLSEIHQNGIDAQEEARTQLKECTLTPELFLERLEEIRIEVRNKIAELIKQNK